MGPVTHGSLQTHSRLGSSMRQGECLLESWSRPRTSRRAVNNNSQESVRGARATTRRIQTHPQKCQHLSSQSQSQRQSWSRYTNWELAHVFRTRASHPKIWMSCGRGPPGTNVQGSTNRAIASTVIDGHASSVPQLEPRSSRRRPLQLSPRSVVRQT